MSHAHTLRNAHLADVMFSAVQSISDLPNPLEIPQSESVIVVLVDGLGLDNLLDWQGYAPTLAHHNVAALDVGFPSTTVNGITTLTTGKCAGQTGMTGYVAKNPATGAPLNLLKGLDGVEIDASAWQAVPTWFERRPDVDSYVVGPLRFAQSGLTKAALRGGTYVSGEHIDDTIDKCVALSTEGRGRLVYGYVPTLDQIGHQSGTGCQKWLNALELLNSAVQRSLPALQRSNVTMLLTADHGMVNVASHLDVDWLRDDPDVDFIGGEPRCLQVFLNDSNLAASMSSKIQAKLGEAVNVVTKSEAIAAGWYGAEVGTDIAARIGDVLMTPTAEDVALGIAKLGQSSTTHMVGQHGGRSHRERTAPLVMLP